MNNSSFYDEDGIINTIRFIELTEKIRFNLVFGIIWLVLACLGIIANGTLILIILNKKKLNDITNCYIFSLSISDLMFTLFCIPFTSYVYLRNNWGLGEVLCKMNHFLSSSSVHASSLTLAAMVYHRCNRIIHHKLLNKNKIIMLRRRKFSLITILVWIISFSLSVPNLFIYTVQKNFDNHTISNMECSLKYYELEFNKFYMSIYNPICFFFTYLIPLVLIVSSYFRLRAYIEFTNQPKRRRRSHPMVLLRSDIELVRLKNNYAAKKISKRFQSSEFIEKNVSRAVAMFMFSFAILWMPTYLFIVFKQFYATDDLSSNVFLGLAFFKQLAHTLSYMTPIINPIVNVIYFNEKFRLTKKLKIILL